MDQSISNVEAALAIHCPNCRQPMQGQNLEQNYHGAVRVNLCFVCSGIWFAHLASVALAPGAVIELFKEIHAHKDVARQAFAARLDCPRCSDALILSYDLGKAGRFSYYRCSRGHGRFTPFFQFLHEKQFVRTLTGAELQHVRLQVRQINCSGCGAPIDLEHCSECQYCHAPVSFLDPEAVEKAVAMWSDADHRRHLRPDPETLRRSLQPMQFAHADQPSSSRTHCGSQLLAQDIPDNSPVVDLVTLGITAIGRLFADS